MKGIEVELRTGDGIAVVWEIQDRQIGRRVEECWKDVGYLPMATTLDYNRCLCSLLEWQQRRSCLEQRMQLRGRRRRQRGGGGQEDNVEDDVEDDKLLDYRWIFLVVTTSHFGSSSWLSFLVASGTANVPVSICFDVHYSCIRDL